MGLNIKNERVCRLAREAAERTGQTQTATTFARLDAVMAPADREAIRTGLEDLYDEATGLPT